MAGWEIDWSSAEVKDAKLTVSLGGEGEDAKKWSGRVQTVLRVLDRSGGKWGEIKVGQDKIQVADLREGAETDLRHLLESAVLQANADLAPSEEDEDGDSAEAEAEADEEARSGDQQMTDAFRSFGTTDDEGEESDKEDENAHGKADKSRK